MKKYKVVNSITTFLVGTAIWCILQNNYTLATLMEAIVFSFIASFIQSKFFLIEESSHQYLNIRPLTIIKYIVNLIIQIYISSFKMIINIIKGYEDVKVVRVPTKLTNHWHRIITATSITLTPGTITITEQKKYFWVVGLDISGETKDEHGEDIKGSFEKILIEEELYKEKKQNKQDGDKK